MLVGKPCCHPATGSTLEITGFQKVRLYAVDDRVDFLVKACGQGLNPHRPSAVRFQDKFQNLPVQVLFVCAASRSELETALEVKDQTKGKPLVGISFSVTRNNYRDLPEVLSFCVDHGIANLVLPMQRLVNETECFSLSAAERHTLTEQVQKVDKPGVKIIIHDPFLWRTFYPTVDFPDGGCQAANTMVYISPEADVYPCPSLPVKIGNLAEEPLREIICSGRKKDLRNILITVPIDGTACDRAASCLGACRGRAFVMTGSLTCCDPACE